MRSRPRVEDGVVLQHDNGGLHRVHRGAASREDAPPRLQRPLATALAVADGVIGDTPRAAMHDQGGVPRGGVGERSQVSVDSLGR